MRFAWIENGVVRDICSGDPTGLFTPNIAALYDTEIGDDIVAGATQVNGVWTNPEPQEPPAPVAARRVLTPPQFKLLFTPEERIQVRIARAYQGSDQASIAKKYALDDWFEIVDDPRLESIDLGAASTRKGIDYLVSIGVLTSERRDEVLGGA